MAASRKDIERWLDVMYTDENITHMEVVCDTYDWEDYPVYIKRGDTPRQPGACGNMQKIMEVYSRNHTKESQLNQGRAFNYD